MKKNFNYKEVIFLVILTCVVSLWMGNAIKLNKIEPKTESDDYLKEFEENYQYILDNYYDEVNKEAIIKGAISGMVNALGDDYSVAINDESSNNFNTRLTGSYSGIGIEIVNDNNYNIIISDVFEDTPAAKAGLKVMDVILSIDDVDFSNKKTSELTDYIKESNKEKYIIKVKRGTEELSFEIARQLIQIKSIYSELKEIDDHKIGYIYISVFASNTADQFKAAVESLEKQGMDSLIIDVRYNTGGHLTSAVEILSYLLSSDKVIYQIESKGITTKYYSKGSETKTYPIVVLQNKNSASASELLSAALKEEYGATIIGEVSYGKGTVQELVTLTDGTQYKFTTKKWLTPKGNWINGVGVSVDIEEALSKEYENNPTEENDNQLQRAVQYLKETD
ncbi:MAG: S41 family peptidase [Tenericutes bacterium]|nr:S41 family peptidase [Mycoplasmatota bacterium]